MEVIELLVDKKVVNFTEAVVKAAARNKENCKGVIILLLQQRDQKISITERVVKAAA